MGNDKEYFRLSKIAFDKKGNILSISKQMQLYKNSKFKTSDSFLIKIKTKQNANKVILISQNIYKKIIEKHLIPLKILNNLEKYINKFAFAMTSKGRLLVFIDEGIKNLHSPYVLMIVIKQNIIKRNIRMSEIRSLYRDNLYSEIKNGIKYNETFYLSKKTKKWLLRRGASLSPSGNNHDINSLADIL